MTTPPATTPAHASLRDLISRWFAILIISAIFHHLRLAGGSHANPDWAICAEPPASLFAFAYSSLPGS